MFFPIFFFSMSVFLPELIQDWEINLPPIKTVWLNSSVSWQNLKVIEVKVSKTSNTWGSRRSRHSLLEIQNENEAYVIWVKKRAALLQVVVSVLDGLVPGFKSEHCTMRVAVKDQLWSANHLCVFMSVFRQRRVCLLSFLSSQVPDDGQQVSANNCEWFNLHKGGF